MTRQLLRISVWNKRPLPLGKARVKTESLKAKLTPSKTDSYSYFGIAKDDRDGAGGW